MTHCYKCQKEVDLSVKPTRDDQCVNCNAFLRCCFNCKHYDPPAPNSCREPNAAWVFDRAAGNFCDYFEFFKGPPREDAEKIKQTAKQTLDQLFKK